MAERNPQIPHSIQTLLYVERREKYCGYKPELITDAISYDLKEFLICSECKGIIRSARHVGRNTVCEMCDTGRGRDADERVVNIVKYLNSKCPLLESGCTWLGVLGEIDEHMSVCSKLEIQCQLKCGIVFERETTEQHNREICPLRMIECRYCKEEIQVKGENQHIGECTYHPDTEIPCPYKELGCDVITLRKNKDIHLTENMIGHQKLLLDQLNQLRNRNQQLEQLNEEHKCINEQQKTKNQQQERVNEQHKDRIGTIEASTRKLAKEYKAKRGKYKRIKRVWVTVGLVATGIAVLLSAVIGITVAASLENGIQYNSQQIESIKEITSQNSEYIKGSTSHISEYIPGRGKVLPGIEWIHGLKYTGLFYGPTFYLGQCNLRLKAIVYSNARTQYYVQRVNGEYDNSISSCRITYTYATYGYLDDIRPKYTSSGSNAYLNVGNTNSLSTTYDYYWQNTNKEVIIRAYFDIEVD